MRTLAVIVAVVFLVRAVVRWGRKEDAESPAIALASKLVLATAGALVLINIFSTVTSVSQRLRLFGAYTRLQGLHSFICEVVLARRWHGLGRDDRIEGLRCAGLG